MKRLLEWLFPNTIRRNENPYGWAMAVQERRETDLPWLANSYRQYNKGR